MPHSKTWPAPMSCLQALDRDLEDAEEQYGTALQGHLQVVDSLQDMQYARTKTMQEQFQCNLKVSSDAIAPIVSVSVFLQVD